MGSWILHAPIPETWARAVLVLQSLPALESWPQVLSQPDQAVSGVLCSLIGYWLVTPRSSCHDCSSISFRQDSSMDQSVCGCLGVSVSTLEVCCNKAGEGKGLCVGTAQMSAFLVLCRHCLQRWGRAVSFQRTIGNFGNRLGCLVIPMGPLWSTTKLAVTQSW